jgi:hypothetical protein|mmetsp:Transcript_11310/g.10949  ORF Transcript_11310/g.10949 Transcript_11310/m.10949 type:complete len:191 (-) Transcript_11310:217-789(-)
MGNICSSCCEKGKYTPIGVDEAENFHNDPGAQFNVMLMQEFDLESSILQGAHVHQKFTSKSVYEPRFIWVNLDSRTIHMSLHPTKDRRHKEASLADVISVFRGAPKRDKKVEKNSENRSLTVNFQRGGGIDLKFISDEECELWCTVLNRIVEFLKSSTGASAQLSNVSLQHKSPQSAIELSSTGLLSPTN